MIAKEYTDSLYEDGNEHLRGDIEDNRKAKKLFYKRDEGVRTLCQLIKSAHVFDKLNPDDAAEIGAYNFAIDMLSEIGFFDEANLEKTVRFFLSLPAFPERGDKE